MSHDLDHILAPGRLDAARARRLETGRRLQDRGCLLFGPGTNGRQLARDLAAMASPPELLGFVSDVAADLGRVVEGLQVISRAQALEQFGADRPVVNCVYRADVTIAAVSKGLADSGFHDVIPLPLMGAIFEGRLPGFFGFGAIDQLKMEASAIAEAYDLLEDPVSRRVMAELVEQRVELDFSRPRPVEAQIYFPDFVDRSRLSTAGLPFVFVDCGAYVGDTIQGLEAWAGNPQTHAVALEPDASSFAKLRSVAETATANSGMVVTCVNAAVGAENGRIGFLNLNNEASRVVADAETTVPVRTVDSVLEELGLQASYVKYDVEGFEREGLEGARRAIAETCAGLAVSVYHRPTDLWRILLLLRDMQPAYEFRLREHGPDGMDTVLYALPRP